MITKFRLDHRGMGELINSPEVRDAVDMAALQVAIYVDDALLRGGERKYPVNIDHRRTVGMAQNRQATDIAITHPAGVALQAKHGVLTRACLAAGLDMNGAVE